MKNIFKLMAILTFVCCFASCDDEEEIIPTLPVTSANLDGVWRMTEWNNGEALPEELYSYIVFNRKEQTFEIYGNLNSMYAEFFTGEFKLKNDPYLGSVISGEYSFGLGKWTNEYIVTNLLPSGEMTWTATEDAEDVRKFVRCEKVPEEIVEESKKDE